MSESRAGAGRRGEAGKAAQESHTSAPFLERLLLFTPSTHPVTPWPWPLQGFLLPTRVRREFGFEGHEPPPFLFQPFSLYPLKPTSMLDCPRRGRTRGRVFRAGRIPRSAWVASPRRQSSPSSTIRCLRIMLKHVCCSRSVDLSRAHADGRAHTRTRTCSHTLAHTWKGRRDLVLAASGVLDLKGRFYRFDRGQSIAVLWPPSEATTVELMSSHVRCH